MFVVGAERAWTGNMLSGSRFLMLQALSLVDMLIIKPMAGSGYSACNEVLPHLLDLSICCCYLRASQPGDSADSANPKAHPLSPCHAHCSEQSLKVDLCDIRQPTAFSPRHVQTPRHDAPLFRLARLGGCGQCFSPLLVPLQHRNCGMDGTRPVRLVACHCQRS